ncbi:MAG: 3-oxoacyl-ACP synthase [Sphingobacteriaceae bacterium]|nr:3-oxoacyl-ACP synthase [Sphingobacteriaceae bacterium]
MQILKRALLEKCSQYVEERIKSAENAITSAKEASQDDTKSSAGDKYETTREMMQQEISRNEAQLYEAMKLKHQLSQISIDKSSDSIQNGSVAITDNGNFFISISAGLLTIENESFFAISSFSPIGKQLIGLRTGGMFSFNSKDYTILDIK